MTNAHKWDLDPTKRWEQGVPHHHESESLFKELAELDFKYCGDYFGWKSGGDGDNGETLMYLLDMLFERREEQRGSRGVVGEAP